MDFMEFVIDDALVMIPVLYMIALVYRETSSPGWHRLTPFIILVISLAFTPILLGGYNPDNIVQAVLVTGATVLIYEGIKQGRKMTNEQKAGKHEKR